LRRVYDRGENFYEEYKVAYNHYIKRTTEKDITYRLVFLSVPNPYGKYFNESFENLMTEWEPKLTTLRKDEYASVM